METLLILLAFNVIIWGSLWIGWKLGVLVFVLFKNMSKWREIPKDAIEKDDDEIIIFIGSDYDGNNYITIKIKDLLQILKVNKH